MPQNQHRILLIEPPFYRLFKDNYSLHRYPLSLGYLSGAIKKETNWQVMVYNADFYPHNESISVSYLAGAGFDNYLNNLKNLSARIWQNIRAVISEYRPRVVGISTKSQNFSSACIVAKLAKEINEEIIVVVGGPHPSMVGRDVLNTPHIDIGVSGEGERTIVDLLKAIEGKKEFDSIPGIVYRNGSEFTENSTREFIEDLDTLSFPHEDASEILKDYDLYPAMAFKNIFSIRGCPHNCFFCGSRKIWSRKARFRSPENIIREIKSLQKKGLKSVHFDDDIFGINKRHISDLCNALIKHCPGLKWSCEIHVKMVEEQTISLMKKAGCYSISIGIESGNNELLKRIRKNITIEEAFRACEVIKKQGVELFTFFMIGFPEETEDMLNDTVMAMKRVKCDYLVYSVFTPYPGTESFEFCKERGLISDSYDSSLFNHQSPANSFCINIPPQKLRILASKVEKMVDRKNKLEKIKKILSLNTIWRIQEVGVSNSLRKAVKIFLGR